MIYGFFTAKTGEMTVIPAAMRLGKSTLLTVFCKYMAITNPEFGCIIVKERVEDMFNLEDELGYVDDTFCEQKICYAWVGYNKDICVKGHPEYEYGLCSRCECSKCRVKSARYEQYNYPVVVITHERLFRNANTQEFIENLKTWRNEHGVIHKRQYIIIDERPKFFASYKKSWGEFSKFISILRGINKKICYKIDTTLIENRGNEIFLNIPDEEARIIHDNEVIDELKKIKKFWWKYCNEDDVDLFPFFWDFFSNGGFRSKANLSTYQYTDYIFDSYKTIVLDGTAKGDMTYPDKKRVIEIDDFRTYENVTIWHCKDFNLSKTRLADESKSRRKSKREKLQLIVPDIIEVSQKGKTLVLCAKDSEEELGKLLSEHENNNIMLAHFNAIKGSNKYVECTNLFFAGTMDFGDDHYVLKAIALDKDKVKTFETASVNKTHNKLG